MLPAELQEWRSRLHLSQAELAHLLEVDKMTVSRWERGIRSAPPFLRLALLYLLDRRGVLSRTRANDSIGVVK
jgi:DNA-binding transcriptional regulator YiaG